LIPLRDVIPSRTTPYITTTIILLNAIAWLYEVSLPERTLTRFLYFYGVVPAAFSAPTLITSMFLHGSWWHVIGNMWYLWIFGDNVEDRVGHGRFILFYLLCGIAAALAQTITAPDSTVPMIGASGAIAGVMGAYFVLYPRSRIVTLIPLFFFFQVIEVPAIFFLGIWFLMQFVSGVGSIVSTVGRNGGAAMGGIAFWAHVAGFVAGITGVALFRRPERQRVEWWHDV
jgi:membrane associated rhomboid family serine protease